MITVRSRRAFAGSTGVIPAVVVAWALAGCGGPSTRPQHAGESSPEQRAQEIAALQQKSMEEPSNPYWLYRMGQLHVAGNDPLAAESALRFALDRDPAHEPSLSLLSKVYYDSQQYEKGVQLLEAAHASQGGLRDELVAALALHYEAMDRLDLADRLAASLEGRMSDWSKSGSALAYVRLRGDDFVNSEEVARRALDSNPSAVNHNNYGIAKLYAGDPETARKSFLAATEIDPQLPGPLYNLAIVERFYFLDEDAARRWFDLYRELESDDPDGLAELLATEVVAEAPSPMSEGETQ